MRSRQRLQAETFRNEEEADGTGAVEWAGDVEGTAVAVEEGLGTAVLVAGSVCIGEVSEGCGLFLPEETGDGDEGGLGIVRTERREPQSCDHLLVEDLRKDCGRELRFNFPGQIYMIRSRSTFDVRR